MSRRQVTTIIASVKLRVPPGSSAAETLDFISRGLREWKTSGNTDAAKFDIDSMLVKLESKQTVYL